MLRLVQPYKDKFMKCCLVHDTKKVWVAVPVTRPTVLASRIAHPCRNEQRRSPHVYV